MNYREFLVEQAQTKGRDALGQARATLERSLAELDRYIASYDSAEALESKADVLNWAIGHLTTYVPGNVRLDMIAGAQAELIRAESTK